MTWVGLLWKQYTADEPCCSFIIFIVILILISSFLFLVCAADEPCGISMSFIFFFFIFFSLSVLDYTVVSMERNKWSWKSWKIHGQENLLRAWTLLTPAILVFQYSEEDILGKCLPTRPESNEQRCFESIWNNFNNLMFLLFNIQIKIVFVRDVWNEQRCFQNIWTSLITFKQLYKNQFLHYYVKPCPKW